MKVAWKILIAAGLLFVVIALGTDTTVNTSFGRVHNIGMQGEQLLMLIFGCVLFLAGIVLYAAKKMKQTREQDEEADRRAVERAGESKAAAQAATKALETAGAAFRELWSKVRRRHIFMVALAVIGLTLLFPPYEFTTSVHDTGVVAELPVRRFVGLEEKVGPLLLLDLAREVFLELIVFVVALFMARK